MVKLIVGKKGTGKTKQLIELVNTSLAETKGSVVCIEKGEKLRYDIKPQCRLIDVDAYGIGSACPLYGFVAGILASNNDVTDLYIDSVLKICKDDLEAVDSFVEKVANISDNINVVMTCSVDTADVTETMKKYL